ncbi:HdeD family acid-resistance protein [Phaeovulum sp.]|uniref:HdeD family acid-resistance protein n=1 Tax=Phaeovulum sp. TaxID=2934796 RepID=UPI0039E3DE6A
MNAQDHSFAGTAHKPTFSKRLTHIGIVFAAIGLLAILLPGWATLAGEILIAWMLLLWGVVGLWFAWEMRPAKEWFYGAILFGLTLLLGLVFLLFPGVGIATLTIVMIIVFLMEGIVSILLGLRISGHLRSWGWMVFSGICSLIVGAIILFGWPETAVWTLGLLLGVNFLSSGLSLIMLGKNVKETL